MSQSIEMGEREPSSLTKVKARAKREFRRFVLLFVYLWTLFSIFVLDERMALREQGLSLTMQGFALINALVFAKVMIVFEVLDPGRWLRGRPLLYPIVFETLLLTGVFFVVYTFEKVLEGVYRGKTVFESLPTIGGGGLSGVLSAGAVMFIMLAPYFAFRNLGVAIGEDRLSSIMFGARRDQQRDAAGGAERARRGEIS
jgi:hypothetical protein